MFDQPRFSASEPPAISSGAMPPSRHPRAVPGPLGPCWRCGAFGHLAASCTATKLYPLSQPVVSSAEVCNVDKVELSLHVEVLMVWLLNQAHQIIVLSS